jgi:type IV secretory pathway VirB10-like protein
MGRIQVFNLRSLTEIPVGSEARATLESGASNGIVKARLAAPMLVDNEPVIPEGATVFGHGRSTEERLFVEFTRAVFPSGESFPIRAQAFDPSDKILGLKGALVGNKTKKMAMGMLLGFMGGMADGLQDTSGSLFEVSRRRSVKDAALSGTAKAALDQSQMNLDQIKNAPEIIEVKQGTSFYLIVDEPKSNRQEEQ